MHDRTCGNFINTLPLFSIAFRLPIGKIGAMSQPTANLMTQQQAAAYLGVSHKTLEFWRRGNEGPTYVRIGQRVRYRPADLDQYIESRKTVPGEGSEDRGGEDA